MKPPVTLSLTGILAVALVWAPGCSEQAPTLDVRQANTFESRLDSLIPRLLAENDVPGLAVGAVEGGRIAFARGYGVADVGTDRPVSAHTLFNFASVSKPVTAWGVLHLVEAGSISLDDPVNVHLRRWRLPSEDYVADSVTVRQLLSHTGGGHRCLLYPGSLQTRPCRGWWMCWRVRRGDADP